MKLEDAIKVLEQAAGVVLPEESDHPLLNPSIYPDEDIFMVLAWNGEEGSYDVEFDRENNQEVEVQGSSLVLKNSEGEEFVITPLFPKELA